MSRTFVIGDIHGAFKALQQCLDRSGFDFENDTLISLGDVPDGWPETRKSFDLLLSVKNLIYIFGNHDFWTLEWMENGHIDDVWFENGGKATVESYQDSVPKSHVQLLRDARLYFVSNNKLFVHAGIDPQLPLEAHTLQTLLWDRAFSSSVQQRMREDSREPLTSFEEVFIGHTPIESPRPLKGAEVWMMDTGAGWSGVLSMMDVNTKEVFTSDPVPSLYPNIKGRQKRK